MSCFLIQLNLISSLKLEIRGPVLNAEITDSSIDEVLDFEISKLKIGPRISNMALKSLTSYEILNAITAFPLLTYSIPSLITGCAQC